MFILLLGPMFSELQKWPFFCSYFALYSKLWSSLMLMFMPVEKHC